MKERERERDTKKDRLTPVVRWSAVEQAVGGHADDGLKGKWKQVHICCNAHCKYRSSFMLNSDNSLKINLNSVFRD